MKKQMTQRGKSETQQPASPSSGEKRKWQQPKLSFVKPKLTKHGKLDEVTGQFFGAFSPRPTNG